MSNTPWFDARRGSTRRHGVVHLPFLTKSYFLFAKQCLHFDETFKPSSSMCRQGAFLHRMKITWSQVETLFNQNSKQNFHWRKWHRCAARTRESNRSKNIILPDGGAITKKEAFQKLIFFLESTLYVTSGNNNTQKIVYLLVIYFTATEWVLFDLDFFISWLLGHRQDKTVLLKTKVTHSFYIKIASVNCFMNDGKYGMHFNAKKKKGQLCYKEMIV